MDYAVFEGMKEERVSFNRQ